MPGPILKTFGRLFVKNKVFILKLCYNPSFNLSIFHFKKMTFVICCANSLPKLSVQA